MASTSAAVKVTHRRSGVSERGRARVTVTPLAAGLVELAVSTIETRVELVLADGHLHQPLTALTAAAAVTGLDAECDVTVDALAVAVA